MLAQTGTLALSLRAGPGFRWRTKFVFKKAEIIVNMRKNPPKYLGNIFKGTGKEKWKGVKDETWESQALNDTYIHISNLYENSYMCNFV